MTTTNLGLNGQPVKFLGAYVKNISSSLGLSTNPSVVTVTLVEDTFSNAIFQEPTVGDFVTISVGPTWTFSGIIKRYERDIRNISGRQINVTIHDAREIMRSIPIILAPGYEAVTMRVRNTECSVLDVFSAFYVENSTFNLSGWNQSGMQFKRIISALHGDNINFGNTLVSIARQTIRSFGETYRFNLQEVADRVDNEYRVNTNLIPLTNLIEDFSQRHSFDWFIESERASDGVIDVTVRIIDRSRDQNTLSLPTFLANHNGRVLSCTSGIELRNDVSCMALMGAPVENLTRLEIKGLANEPIDLAANSGSHRYLMTETEMRVVLGGKIAWEIWLGVDEDNGGGGGFSRYGGILRDEDIDSLFVLNQIFSSNLIDSNGNLPKNKKKKANYLLGIQDARFQNAGRIYEKLHAHAEATYGKRWVHGTLFDEVIESAWTRDVVAGDNDPNTFFRQSDGRTRAYVEFNNSAAGGGGSLGLTNLRNLFGNQNVFKDIINFSDTFSTTLPGDPGDNGAIINCELRNQFYVGGEVFNTDKSNYVYNDPDKPFSIFSEEIQVIEGEGAGGNQSAPRHTLWMSCTIDRDGVVTLPTSVVEKLPTPDELLNIAIRMASASGNQTKRDAEGNTLTVNDYLKDLIKRFYGTALFEIAARCYQPNVVYVPTRSRYLRYGPVFSSELDGETQGKLEILQDDGFAPWEFGGLSLMSGAMQLKVDNATSLQREIFSANINVEGYPELNIGDALEKNANINSISISFGSQLTTSYGLQTFTRKFGEFTKEDWARLALFGNGAAARALPQNQISHVNNAQVVVTKQYPSLTTNRSIIRGGNNLG